MISRFHPAGPLHRAFSAACALIAGAVLVSAAPGLAQQRTVATDDDGAEPVATTSVPVVQSVAPSPTRTLNAALAKLARDPRDVTALLDAGGAALDLGDTDAAIGFLTRAEQVAPGTAGVRARMGVAMLRSNQPIEAIRWFDLAEQAGFSRTEMATERGLAYDLVGDNAAAQRQYQLALAGGQNDEASRRYALSLVIAGDRRGAELVIQPLLERQDRGAWRVRTFIMAIAGQSDEAEGIARATMPADLAAAIAPYLRYLPRLTPAQQAAAANLGRFPRAADIGRDDPQVVQYALAHPRAPRVDASLVPQGDALGARGRDDRSKRRRPGKDDKRQTAMAAAAPVSPTPNQPAVTAPWGLQPATRIAAAPTQAQPQMQPQSQPQVQPGPAASSSAAASQPVRPAVLSKLDVPPGTPVAPPPQPKPRAAAPAQTPPAQISPAQTSPAPAPAPVQVASAGPAVPASAPTTQLALAATPPAATLPAATSPVAAVSQPVAQLGPDAQSPAASPAPTPPAPEAASPAAPTDFRSAFDGFKPPEQEAETATDAVDLARIEALRQSAKASRSKGRDRGERPDGPTSVSRTSDQEAVEPAVTRPGKEKPGSDKTGKDKSAKGKAAGKAGKAAAPAKAKSGARSGKGKGKDAADVQCPPETDKSKKGKSKAEPQYASRIWVQVLTGSNRAAIGKEWLGLQARAALLRGRKPSITPWRSNYRLLIGPFSSDAEAQATIEKLRTSGVGSYEWTSPAGQAVDALSVK